MTRKPANTVLLRRASGLLASLCGSLAALLGYVLSSAIGNCSVCAAGRAPLSLALILGFAVGAAVWSLGNKDAPD